MKESQKNKPRKRSLPKIITLLPLYYPSHLSHINTEPAAEAEVITQIITFLSLALPAWEKNEELKMSSTEHTCAMQTCTGAPACTGSQNILSSESWMNGFKCSTSNLAHSNTLL